MSLLSSLIAIIGSLFAFFLVVVVHEFGHFIIARCVKIKVLRFSVGFGKPIFSRVAKSGVEYTIGWLPIGGYVRMQDAFSVTHTNTLEKADKNVGSVGDAFEQKSVLARMAVIIAGPLANLILALLLFVIVYSIGVTHIKPIIGTVIPNSFVAKANLKPGDHLHKVGQWTVRDWQSVSMALIMHLGNAKPLPITVTSMTSEKRKVHQLSLRQWQIDPIKPDLFRSLGFTPYFPTMLPIVADIVPHSPASRSALKVGDRILSLNQTPVANWQALVADIESMPGKSATLVVQRGAQQVTLAVTVGERDHLGFLGIQPKPPVIPASLQSLEKYAPWNAVIPAFEETKRWIFFQFTVLKQMLTGEISLKTIGGPVSIFQTAGTASLAGLLTYLQFIAFISVVVGILNILPIPALDGGHLLFCVIEGVIQRPIPARIQTFFTNLGVAFLLTLMLFATANDLMRLFG